MAEHRGISAPALTDLLFEETGAALCLVAPDGKVVRANAGWLGAAGHTREQIAGRDVIELLPAPRDQALEMRALARAGHRVEIPRHARRVLGRETWWEGSISPVPMEGGTGLLVTLREIGSGAQGRLRAALDQLTAHVATTPLAAIEWDAEYRVASFSPRAEQLFGWRAAEVAGKRIDEAPWVPEEDRPAVRAVMRDMSSGVRPANVNARRNVRRDGSTIYCEWYDSALRDPGGNLQSVLSLVLDVTERKKAEERAESLARFPRENPDPIIRLTADLAVAYANDAARALLGGDELEPGAVAPPTLTEAARRALAEARRERIEIRWGDAWVSFHFVPVGNEVNVYGQDVTARKRSEEALYASEARARGISANIRDLLVVVEAVRGATGEVADWRYVEVNEGALQLVGLPRERVIGRTVREVLPDRSAVLHGRLSRVLASGAVEHYEASIAGRTLLTRLFRIDDRTVGSAAVDITELERAGQALRAANARLVEADRRKDEFIGMLSHELRNPLAPIRNSVYILEHADTSGEQAARARGVIKRQTEHLTRLVDDLLDVTRIARGKVELRRERADLRELVRRASDDFRSVMEDRGVAFRIVVPGVKVWADADPTRLTQVIGNLLHNAAKFTRSGDGVTLSLRALGNEAEIRVSDTGAGIDPALLQQIFAPFVQGQRTLARTEGGLGLGLALVKGIVELHGGEARAESAGKGKGADFVVTLPLAEPAAAQEEPRGGGGPAPAGRRVLVVDDNVDAAESLADIVKILGHEVEVAYDGPSALERA
ncbi:MAG TPA: PAS domain S-box protein, partial [Anaeromyxobacter sp.]